MNQQVRVRFAPSPTGPLHIGGVRTALYNYLFARKYGGKFILRIEDTDQNRYVPDAEEYILETLKWLSILPDEGPEKGGPFSPYRQSDRKARYPNYAKKLLDEGKAYYAFDTQDELEEMRKRLNESGIIMPQYNAITRTQMKNSLTLPPEEVQDRLNSGEPYVIRLKVPRGKEIRFQDEIRDWVLVSSDTIDDKIIIKSDGMPTYHLANVVDDHEMGITHVIRGEEWLPSAPLHVLMYEFFGWTSSRPRFAHLPLILKPEGVGKLSKRDGDKHGFPVFPIAWTDPFTGEKSKGFRESGYQPEALINFLALLGWNPGTEQELFNIEGLIKLFSLKRVNKSGAKFDIEKAKWINHQFLKDAPTAVLSEQLVQDLKNAGISADKTQVGHVADAFRERITFLNELFVQSKYFFIRPAEYDEKVISNKWTPEAVNVIQTFGSRIEEESGNFDRERAKKLLNEIFEEKNTGAGTVMQALRVAVTGVSGGIDLMLTLEILGPDEVAERIRIAINKLSEQVKK
ncbi:MAG: glutamate--tRNA ligase [Cyclobacteriaceae bacterium]|nr:glutamate--tRNA ligase [Cyclobacteriaceae bacterium]